MRTLRSLQPADVGVAAQEPQQLDDDRAQVELLGRQQRETRRRGRSASARRTRTGCRFRCGPAARRPRSRIRCMRSRYWRIGVTLSRAVGARPSRWIAPYWSEFRPNRTRFEWASPPPARSCACMRYQRAELPLKLDGLGAARTFFRRLPRGSAIPRARACGSRMSTTRRAACTCLAHDGDETRRRLPVARHHRRRRRASAAPASSSPTTIRAAIARPSDPDCRATRRLATAAEALDCTVLDHLVFGGDECTSLRAAGLL